MKMLKLLQELRGFSMVTDRRPSNRHPALAAMPVRRSRSAAVKRFIHIRMQDPIDIPTEVRIHFLKSPVESARVNCEPPH